MDKNLVVFILLFLFVHLCSTYKPVVLVHGIMTGSGSMEMINHRIQEKHPGTKVYNVNRFESWSSLETMWHQVMEIGMDIANFSSQHPEGINLIAGFLHVVFPGLVKESAYELFYSRVGQHTSVGNYWKDPYHQTLYETYSVYLPYINNHIQSVKSDDFKSNLLRLKRLVLIGGPDDQVITPWESSQFGYYDVNETVVGMRDQEIYQSDRIGLRALDESNRLHIVTVPGVNHFNWHMNVSIVDDYLLPYLD
ncbi:lysosomal thioesterase PPT2 homolog isoform X2 [Maniola hyperantus]|uniref:lysosomal thioesterase PPT2 homolog isoform X2 n=1 Tax=Aphantopus hyperantus TaxID=2795564 RepID=UPI0021302E93